MPAMPRSGATLGIVQIDETPPTAPTTWGGYRNRHLGNLGAGERVIADELHRQRRQRPLLLPVPLVIRRRRDVAADREAAEDGDNVSRDGVTWSSSAPSTTPATSPTGLTRRSFRSDAGSAGGDRRPRQNPGHRIPGVCSWQPGGRPCRPELPGAVRLAARSTAELDRHGHAVQQSCLWVHGSSRSACGTWVASASGLTGHGYRRLDRALGLLTSAGWLQLGGDVMVVHDRRAPGGLADHHCRVDQ